MSEKMIGKEVTLVELQNAAHLNRTVGTIVETLNFKNRFPVQISSGKIIAVRPKNLLFHYIHDNAYSHLRDIESSKFEWNQARFRVLNQEDALDENFPQIVNTFFTCMFNGETAIQFDVDPNIGSSIKAFGSRFWSTIKKGWSSFDRAVKKKTSFQSGVWFDLMLKKKWSVIDLWSSFKNLIWFDPTLAQESWVWSTFDRPLKTWFDLIQLSLKQVEFDRPLIVLWKLDLIWSNSRSRKLSLIDLWSSFKNLIVL